MDNNRVLSSVPKPWNPLWIGRGAFQWRRRRAARHSGASGKANAGISNDKGGGMPPRRKAKVSGATLIVPGSVGS